MNSLRRAVAQISYSQFTIKRIVLEPTALLAQAYSTRQPRKTTAAAATTSAAEADVWPRPTEIPFQVKAANSVNLIGHVDSPVQFQASSDGKHWAGTVITQTASSYSPQLWIPVVFEGDLAHIAACHLKKNDHVHISGQLTADPPPANAIHLANVQVMAHTINFIEPSSQMRKAFVSQKQEEVTVDHPAGTRKVSKSTPSSWHYLLDNPNEWWDYRSHKLSGLVNPKHPDFKRKDGSLSLWLDKASGWVLSELERLEFDVQTLKSKYPKQGKGVKSDVQIPKSQNAKLGVESSVQTPKAKSVQQQKDESWKDLTENPNNWWDNRFNKFNKNSPDFKHKKNGEALWLSSAPSWVLPQLPIAVKSENKAAVGKRDTLLS